MNKIILLGYMGSGKSAVGFSLKQQLGFDYIDLDHYMKVKMKINISDIFNSKGEIYFRKKERQYLEEVLKENVTLILSLGGGTPCYYDSMAYINAIPDVKTIYLKTSVKELSKRLFNDEADRPLIKHLKSEEAIKEFVGKHLFERSVFYNEAHLSILTDGKSIVQVVDEIKKRLA